VSARLEWGGDSEREVASVDDLDRAVDELEATAPGDPLLVELFRDDGASLSLGLGRSGESWTGDHRFLSLFA
jgi:hypothetical protein